MAAAEGPSTSPITLLDSKGAGPGVILRENEARSNTSHPCAAVYHHGGRLDTS